MSDLNERLDHAFRTVEPGPAPVEAAMEHGKKIRNRRWATAVAGSVAVIAGAVACVPVLAHHQALPAPSTSHVRVTVNPPGPHAPAGTIASGLVGKQPWDLRIEDPQSKNCLIEGTDLSTVACNGSLTLRDAASPVSFDGASGIGGANGFDVSYGVVRNDVVSVRVDLADGAVLTLRPATAGGLRFVAFAVPDQMGVDSLTAYSRTGQIATAIPWNGPVGPFVGAWLRPGQAVSARFAGAITRGVVGGRPWQLIAYVGPWGICMSAGGNSYCSPQLPLGTREMGVLGTGGSIGQVVVFGSVGASVSSVVVTLPDGTTTRSDIAAVGPQRYFALGLSQQTLTGARWTAYDSAGTPVGSGALP